jgi:hypothetical protein
MNPIDTAAAGRRPNPLHAGIGAGAKKNKKRRQFHRYQMDVSGFQTC